LSGRRPPASATSETGRRLGPAPAVPMKAVLQDAYGSADTLALGEALRPEIGDDEVLIRVLAAGVDRGSWHRITGRPYVKRIVGSGLRAPKVSIPGSDLAGVVEAVGAGVTRFVPGDAVYGTAPGALAEYARTREGRLAPVAPGLGFEQAAVLPYAGVTALQAIRDHARLRRGQRVLVIGASGAVGTMAVQIASALGGEVTGVCRTANFDLVRRLGAKHVVDYRHRDVTDGHHRYDVILDLAGSRPLSRLRNALAPDGTLVFVAGDHDNRWTGGFERRLGALFLSPFVAHQLRVVIARPEADDLLALNELVGAGMLTPVVGRIYDLCEAADAFRDLETRSVSGRLVVTA
jgi:NADPH:quinone reductase-like Zn-dependent oxidoreductase